MPHGKTVPSSTKMSFRCNPPHPPQHGQGDENKGYSVGPNGAYYVTAVNRQRFSPAEWRDVGLMLTLLREDMPTLLGSRDAVWPALCAAMARWEKAHSESLRVALNHDRSDWKLHHRAYMAGTRGMLLRLRYAREKRARRAFTLLCTQHNVSTIDEMEPIVVAQYHDERESSTIYIGISLKVDRYYFGQVQERNPMARFEDHWRETLLAKSNTTSTEWKYRYMSRHGGTSWYFIPLVIPGQILPRATLSKMESFFTGLYPKSLNCEARRTFGYLSWD